MVEYEMTVNPANLHRHKHKVEWIQRSGRPGFAWIEDVEIHNHYLATVKNKAASSVDNILFHLVDI